MTDKEFWRNRKVFITGHTGFKGAWLCLWLHALGAEVTGYALDPPTKPSLYELLKLDSKVKSKIADVRDGGRLKGEMAAAAPEVVIHMAAQPLVLDSYQRPAETYEINVMGTVNLMEAVRATKSVRSVVNVTTDKCYENMERASGYREDERLGGYDPYSNSKACSELVTQAFRNSFFNPDNHASHGVGLASARAGNVIGGGDWAPDRLLPDCVRAVLSGDKIMVRNPGSVRPWQHVLGPLSGYMLLARRLFEDGPGYSAGWNFGPDERDARTVEWVVRSFCEKWGEGASYEVAGVPQLHEAGYLKLDCSKAMKALGWRARWDLDRTLDSIVEWTRAYRDGKGLMQVSLAQIEEYSDA